MRSLIIPEQLLHFKSFASAELGEESSATCSHFPFQQEYNNAWELHSSSTTFSLSIPSMRGDQFSSF